jgi:hypothetical protein
MAFMLSNVSFVKITVEQNLLLQLCFTIYWYMVVGIETTLEELLQLLFQTSLLNSEDKYEGDNLLRNMTRSRKYFFRLTTPVPRSSKSDLRFRLQTRLRINFYRIPFLLRLMLMLYPNKIKIAITYVTKTSLTTMIFFYKK